MTDAPKKSVGEDLQWWENRYATLNAKVGDVARQLNFGRIACIWIFRQGVSNVVALPRLLILAALLFLIAGTATALRAGEWRFDWR